MIYRDVSTGTTQIILTYDFYKEILSKQPIHEEIIKTVRQYTLDIVAFFKDDFFAHKVFEIANQLYFQENAIMSYNSNSGTLSTILASYCVRYVAEGK